MIDYNKLSFNEMDNDEMPVQFFFNYNGNKEEINKIGKHLIPNIDEEVTNIELCWNMYSKNDWKLEAVITYEGEEQEWVDIIEQSFSAEECIDILKNTNTDDATEAYAHYEYVKEYGYAQ